MFPKWIWKESAHTPSRSLLHVSQQNDITYDRSKYLGSRPEFARNDSQTWSIDQLLFYPSSVGIMMLTDRTNFNAGMIEVSGLVDARVM
jgi:hypothetical protein